MNEVKMSDARSQVPSINEARIVSSTGNGNIEPPAETPHVIELGEVFERPYYIGQDL